MAVNTAFSRERKLNAVLCEVQLHLATLYEQKTQGGGHAGYVQRRNMLAM